MPTLTVRLKSIQLSHSSNNSILNNELAAQSRAREIAAEQRSNNGYADTNFVSQTNLIFAHCYWCRTIIAKQPGNMNSCEYCILLWAPTGAGRRGTIKMMSYGIAVPSMAIIWTYYQRLMKMNEIPRSFSVEIFRCASIAASFIFIWAKASARSCGCAPVANVF